ncbi:MAG: hypothetical protein WC867_00730 [Candidatus Pacearchaeota archaeon]|jgi:hypothetical protein
MNTNIESLISIAQKAGYYNLLGPEAMDSRFFGRIITEEHEIIYIRKIDENKVVRRRENETKINPPDIGDLELFGFSDPYDYSNCRVYRMDEENPFSFYEVESNFYDITYFDLDSRCPMYSGERAVEYIKKYIKE